MKPVMKPSLLIICACGWLLCAPSANAQEATTQGAPPQATDSTASSAANAGDVHKEGEAEVKVLEFTGLDIEGQLKTPQMLYFLSRLKAEFGRPRLPHRSFIPELVGSTKEKPLR